jgi:hypothetical protein
LPPSGIIILTGAAAVGIGISAPEADLRDSMATHKSFTDYPLFLILLFIIVTFMRVASILEFISEISSSAFMLFISSSFIIFYSKNKRY